MLSEAASERLQLRLDAQVHASRAELARLQDAKDAKRGQTDADALKQHLADAVDKYNALVVRHVQLKARRKAQVE